MAYHLTPSQRRKLVEKIIKEGSSISKASRELNISRPTIYKWLQTYKERMGKRGIFKSRQTRPKKFYRQASLKQEKMVRWALEQAPTASKYELSRKIKARWGKKGLGPTGVYKVLKRLGLNQPEERIRLSTGRAYHLSPELRKLIVEKIIQRKFPINRAAKLYGVSRPTIYK